jgi:NADPH-dependent 2,4-dienoyl-CoA reductase/sulfur reductase-like enzyme
VILGRAKPAGRICVIGSGLTGLETAEMLLAAGEKKVSIIEMLPQIAPGIFPAIRNDELSRLKEAELLPGCRLTEVREGSIMLEHADGTVSEKECDTVVLALGVKPDGALTKSLKAALPDIPVLAAGDARKAGRIATAVREGYELAYRL